MAFRRFLNPAIAAGLLLFAGLIVAFVVAAETQGAECSGGSEKKTVEVGIVKATGCWTQSGEGEHAIYTARFGDNPEGVDLNGFIVTGAEPHASTSGLEINAESRQVRSVDAGQVVPAQLNSHNWPAPGGIDPLGAPMKIDFTAPMNSELLLEDLRFGSNSAFVNALAGLSPVGTVETPVKLEPDGKGSMDLNVALAGYFTLKGKPQSATIALPTAPEEGTKLDGFELHLQEIDAIKAFTINDLEAKYSAERKDLEGSANVSLPFFAKGVGAGVGVGIQNGILTKLKVSVHGVDIPVAASGTITDIEGGFAFQGEAPLNFDGYCKSIGYQGAVIEGAAKGPNAFTHWKCHKANGQNDGIDVDKACQWQSKNPSGHAEYRDPNDANSWKCVGMDITHLEGSNIELDLLINAAASAVFGSPRASPFGKIEPIGVDAGLQAGYTGGGFLVRINGGLKVFRLPVGDAHLILHANNGIDLGFGLGIGFPSYTNNDNDPFYVGLGVDGWMGKGMFQLEGKGRISLFGVRILDGDGLVNDQAVGACWTVIGFPGGAVYKYGDKVRDFGFNNCGLGDYREQFPGGARISANRGRQFTLNGNQGVIAVVGSGGAPRFELRAKDGRVFHTPTDRRGVMASDHAFFINEDTNQTHVVLRHPRGTWTITPDQGSAPIVHVRAGGRAPKEHVTAKIRGHGVHRTLVWHSLNRAHTRLLFTEQLPGGPEMPILRTDKPNGRKHFKVATKGYFGKRRLRVVVLHGFGSVQHGVVDGYRVNRPRLLPGPRNVVAVRNDHDVLVKWSRARRAHGYLVQVVMRSRKGKLLSSYVRRVSAKRRRALIPNHPGGGRAEADVYALNVDDRPGVVARDRFLTNPSVRTLKGAAKLDVRSASLHGGGVALRTQCPRGGHCRTQVKLLLNGRRIAGARFQQTPDTFHRVLVNVRRSLRPALQRHRRGLRVVVRVHRTGHHSEARGPVSR